MDPTRVCQICGDHAKPTEKFYTHYGAICCLGCKAFFRRIHQDGKDVGKLKCRLNNNCDLTGIKRTKCQKCRYNKCLHVGLRSEFVLNEEDRKKYTHPKKNKRPRLDEDQPSSSSNSNFNSTVHNNSSEESPERSRSASPKNTMAFVMNQILTDYAIATVETSLDENVAKVIISGHLSSIWTKEHTEAFFVAVQHVMRFFANFAQKNTYFMSLCPEDQGTLLTNNSKLYAQYVMSRYFGATNGLDQLTWLLGPNMPLLTIDEIHHLHQVTFDAVNIEGMLIPYTPTNYIQMLQYKDNFMSIEANFKYPHFHSGFIGSFLLFSVDNWESPAAQQLTELSRISSICSFFVELIRYGCRDIDRIVGTANLNQLVHTLSKMQEVMQNSTNNLTRVCPDGLMGLHLRLDEKKWVSHKVDIYRKANSRVKMDMSLIEALMKLSQGDHELKNWILTDGNNMQTLRNFYKLEGLIQGISLEEKKKLASMNFDDYASLIFINLIDNRHKSFKDQIEFLQGTNEEINIPGLENSPKLTIDHFHGVIPVHRKHELQCNLRSKICNFVRNEEVLVLALFMILLNKSENVEVKKAHDCFRTVLQRKLMDEPDFRNEEPKALLNNFLSNLLEYSKLKKKIVHQCCCSFCV